MVGSVRRPIDQERRRCGEVRRGQCRPSQALPLRPERALRRGAGGVYAWTASGAFPYQAFNLMFSLQMLAMIVIGGMGRCSVADRRRRSLHSVLHLLDRPHRFSSLSSSHRRHHHRAVRPRGNRRLPPEVCSRTPRIYRMTRVLEVSDVTSIWRRESGPGRLLERSGGAGRRLIGPTDPASRRCLNLIAAWSGPRRGRSPWTDDGSTVGPPIESLDRALRRHTRSRSRS